MAVGCVGGEYCCPNGPSVTVLIGKPGVPPTRQFRLLIDTGAQKTAIKHSIAEQLGLQSVGQKDTVGAHGQGKLRIHRASISISIEGGSTGMSDKELWEYGGDHRDGVLGRDILCQGTLYLDGNYFRLCFPIAPEPEPSAKEST